MIGRHTREPMAYTLVEALVATVVGLAVLTAVISLFVATRRMSNAGDLSSAMAEAAMAMETLHRDLIQAVQKPDPGIDRIVFVSREAAQFIRGERRADGVLVGQLVVYRREPAAAPGHFRLIRRLGAVESRLPGTYSSAAFASFSGTGGPFVRVTLHAVARDVETGQPRQGSDEAVLTSLIRVAGPEMIESPLHRVKAMDELEKVELLRGSLGF